MKPALLLAFLALAPLTGCHTLNDAKAAKGHGTTRGYDAPFARVWGVVPAAATDLGLTIAGTYESEKYYLAERGVTAFSWGERIAVFVSPDSQTRTSVEVVSKRAGMLNITARDFEESLLDKIGEKLHENR